MGDLSRRALRHAAEAGDLESQARLLVERLRGGELTEAGLRLAAALGDQGAALALGVEAAAVTDDLRELLELLDAIGKAKYLVRAAVAGAERVLPQWVAVSADPTPRWALEAALAWYRCPCGQHRDAAREAGDRAEEATLDLPPGPANDPYSSACASAAARSAADAARVASDPVPISAALAALEHAKTSLQWGQVFKGDSEAEIAGAVRRVFLAMALPMAR